MRFLSLLCIVFLFANPVTAETSNEMKDTAKTLYDFSSEAQASDWRIVNDGVMGGVSQSNFNVEPDYAVFEGEISLENNGGFASVRAFSSQLDLEGYTHISIRVKGDGKRYQFRIRDDNGFDGVSHRHYFDTTNREWQVITFPLDDFVPVFRGRTLSNVGKIKAEKIQQVGFLIANGKAEKFRLEIDWIKAVKN